MTTLHEQRPRRPKVLAMMVSGLGVGVIVASIIGGVALAADRDPMDGPAGSATVGSEEHHEHEESAEPTSPGGEPSTSPDGHIGSAPGGDPGEQHNEDHDGDHDEDGEPDEDPDEDPDD